MPFGLGSPHLLPLSKESRSHNACCEYLKPSVLLSSFLVVCGGRVNLDPDALSWPEANILRTNYDKEIAVGEVWPKTEILLTWLGVPGYREASEKF